MMRLALPSERGMPPASCTLISAETVREIERERQKALQALRIEAADLALTVAEKVLERSLSDDDHRRLAQQAVQAVAAAETQK